MCARSSSARCLIHCAASPLDGAIAGANKLLLLCTNELRASLLARRSASYHTNARCALHHVHESLWSSTRGHLSLCKHRRLPFSLSRSPETCYTHRQTTSGPEQSAALVVLCVCVCECVIFPKDQTSQKRHLLSALLRLRPSARNVIDRTQRPINRIETVENPKRDTSRLCSIQFTSTTTTTMMKQKLIAV